MSTVLRLETGRTLPGVGGTVCTGNLDGSGAGIASAGNFELEAGHVELSSTNTAGDVKRYKADQIWWPIERTEMRTNDFSTDQIVSRSNTGGDGESEVAAVVLLKASRTVVKSNIS